MAVNWHIIFPSGSRRRYTVSIVCGALIPFTLFFMWLLSSSQPRPLNIPRPTPGLRRPGHHTPPADEDANTIRTTTGYFTGKLDDEYPDVREFLNIPYALPPTGDRRFAPPVRAQRSDGKYNATAFGKACPQFISAAPSVWSELLPWYRIPHTQDEIGDVSSLTHEDCLSLAIWTPSYATQESGLPVAMFWPGGGFQTNGIPVPAHQPAQWVSRSQRHLVVTINYRLGVLGFPNAEGLEDQNLGLMDQRAALEWVKDNIHYFGGDPGAITVWGFSAGAQSVDIYNYAYYNDPIAWAFFAQSGSCLAFGAAPGGDHEKFSFLAKKMSCDYPGEPDRELACMRGLDYDELIGFLGQYNGNTRLRFGPVVDEKLVFSDYRERYAAGKVSKVPMIYSSSANEGSVLSKFNAEQPEMGPNQDSVNEVTKRIMCGASESANLRYNIGLKTFRYQYAGVWPNQNPYTWLGAYHGSDLPLIFGTYENGSGLESQEMERKTSEAMQDMLLSFIREPHWNANWPAWDPTAKDQGKILRFGTKSRPLTWTTAKDMEAICGGEGTYDPFP